MKDRLEKRKKATEGKKRNLAFRLLLAWLAGWLALVGLTASRPCCLRWERMQRKQHKIEQITD